MWRLRNDRGAVAVIVAVMMVPLLACAALVVDVGALYLRKSELQNVADAGALAIAQDCASGRLSCSRDAPAPAVSDSALSNASGDASATAAFNFINVTQVISVTVIAKSTVKYEFAPVIGIDIQPVVATSTASWGGPIAGRSVLPVVFSWCSFFQQTGGGLPTATTTPIEIEFAKKDGTSCNHSGNVVPGGFGWLKTDDNSCFVTSSVSDVVHSDPGSSSKCADSVFPSQVGKTVLLPLFVISGDNGNNAWYQVYGYAAFKLTSFHFQGSHNSIFGYFRVFVEPSDAFTYGEGAPDLGARVVNLCIPGLGGNCR